MVTVEAYMLYTTRLEELSLEIGEVTVKLLLTRSGLYEVKVGEVTVILLLTRSGLFEVNINSDAE